MSRPTAPAVRRLGPVYLALQGVGTMIWWIGLYNSDTVRSAFVPTDAGWDAVQNLVIPDVAVFGGLSLLAAVLLWTNHRFANASLFAIVGAALYATAVAWSWIAAPVEHWLGAVIMTISFVCTAGIAWLSHE